MNFFKSIQTSLVILLALQIGMLIGCAQYEELTNDPPRITTFTVPNEVEYGETVDFKVRVFDPENNPLTYTWDVSDGTLIGEAGPQVQWTAPELPLDPIVPPKAVTVYIYVRDGGEEDVHKMATIIVFSKAHRIAEALSGTYKLVSKQVQGDPVEEAGILRLTTTTFTREIENVLNGEVQEPTQFVTGSFSLIEPFDERKGTIHWFPAGDPTPTISTYTWDGKLFVIFYSATSTSYIYQR